MDLELSLAMLYGFAAVLVITFLVWLIAEFHDAWQGLTLYHPDRDGPPGGWPPSDDPAIPDDHPSNHQGELRYDTL